MRFLGSLLLCFLFITTANAAEEFRSYFNERNRINSAGDLAVIHHHQKQKPSLYLIVDKKEKKAFIFGEQGQSLYEIPVRVSSGDELDKGGAGIYSYAGTHQTYHYGKAEKDSSVHALFSGNVHVPPGTPVYVLPETSNHRFRIRNNTLIFGASQVLKKRPQFNYSPLDMSIPKSEMSVDLSSSFLKKYVRALQDEKAELMKLLRLDNDEYNMLAEFAFGVLSPETDFAQNWKYRLKQTVPVVVSLAKGNGLDVSANSRGPTQIKRIPDVISEKYGFQKNELYKPEVAAITTLAFVSEQVRELRNMASLNEDITEESLQDYLYYLYNGRRNEIKNKTATPEQNISIRKIKAALEHLHIQDE